MEYKIIRVDKDTTLFERKVNEHLKEGWTLLGAPIVTSTGDLNQAMTYTPTIDHRDVKLYITQFLHQFDEKREAKKFTRVELQTAVEEQFKTEVDWDIVERAISSLTRREKIQRVATEHGISYRTSFRVNT